MKKFIAALTAGAMFLGLVGVVFAGPPCGNGGCYPHKKGSNIGIKVLNTNTHVMTWSDSGSNTGQNSQRASAPCCGRVSQGLKTGMADATARTSQDVNYTAIMVKDVKMGGVVRIRGMRGTKGGIKVSVGNHGTTAKTWSSAGSNTGQNSQGASGRMVKQWTNTGMAKSNSSTTNGVNVVSITVRH